MNEKARKITGLLTVLILSFTILAVFFGNLFGKLNTVCFASGGDGMQSYVNMEYHIRYDTSYMRCNSMNYPYGEHEFFANNQPLISNTLKFISANITDISDYTLGIINILMLLSLAITPLILYIIFSQLGVGVVPSVIASLAIACMSPQIDRFGGHFNLSYVCAIPFMILLLLNFFRKPSVFLSVIIFLYMLAGALAHFYMYGFFAVLLLFLYGYYFFNENKIFQSKTILAIHLLVQLILPFLILQAFYISDHITDRPSYPWGFLYYRAYPQSVLLPMNRPYGQFLHHFINTSYIDWEGYAFIGLLAFAGTMFFVVRLLNNLVKKQYAAALSIVSDKNLNVMFWASFAALLYSFGLPFILGLRWLIDLIGPIRQMRGIARFSWIFFYIMNIVTVYWLWKWWQKEHVKRLKWVVFAFALLILCIDGWYNIRNRGRWLENDIPALTDRALKLSENSWIKRIDLSRYQAFIPIPYFHVGSENFWIDKDADMITKSYVTIKNSGLPCMGVMLSRTSLHQTIENISLMLGPPCNSLNMDRFPSKKPFLLIVSGSDYLSIHEKLLIDHSVRIDSSGTFGIYELPFSAFSEIADSVALAVKRELSERKLFDHNGIWSTDSLLTFQYLDFDSLDIGKHENKGCFTGKAKDRNELFKGYIPTTDTFKNITVSFWLDHISGDLYPRTRIILKEISRDGTALNIQNFVVSKQTATIQDDKALVEFTYKMSDSKNKIILIVQNKELRNKTLVIDDLLLRYKNTDVYRESANGAWKNNMLQVICYSR
ncbi:MAG TPA: hypothetical protein VK179_06490 [Bacteroidales bacterium]|nr:hypothetical protein [Bacteroidales bacterium]